jgi:PAS domain-containing protein
MSAKEVEMILARHLASYLAVPIFIVDPDGTLLYYNEPAESLLGSRYEETGEMRVEEWATQYVPMGDDGAPLAPQALPLVRALGNRRPAHGAFWIRGMDGVPRHIQVTAFPIIGQAERYLGAMALFWESQAE